MPIKILNLDLPKGAAEPELMFNNLNGMACGRFIEQKLMLSSSFMCHQIYNC